MAVEDFSGPIDILDHRLEWVEFAIPLEDDDAGRGASDDLFIERPYRLHDRGAVAVFPAPVVGLVSAGEVDLGDAVERQAIQKFARIIAVVVGVVEHVGDIQQQGAVGLFGEPAQEVRLAEPAVRDREVVGDILEGEGAAEFRPRLDVGVFEPLDGDLLERHREEDPEVGAIHLVKGEMLAEDFKLVGFEESPGALEVAGVRLVDAADRQGQTVRRGRQFCQRLPQEGEIGISAQPALPVDVIFGGDLDEIEVLGRSHDRVVDDVAVGEADPVRVVVEV